MNPTDLIDRQAAIDIAKDLLIKMDEYHQYNQAVNNYCAELMKLPSSQSNLCEDTVSRQAAIDALWKALYKYEDKTEKQFQDSDELDADDWFVHRIFVQNMSDIDRQTILELPSVQPERKKGKWLLSDEQRREDTENGNYLFFCSNCLRSDIHAKTQEVPFCWWCGCDMRGEHE